VLLTAVVPASRLLLLLGLLGRQLLLLGCLVVQYYEVTLVSARAAVLLSSAGRIVVRNYNLIRVEGKRCKEV